MYSKELEELIEASIADGVITPQEQAALIRRAQQEGVDPNELAVVVNGRLEKNRQQKKAADEKKRADSRNSPATKCPHCGAMISRLTGKCPECGGIIYVKESSVVKDFRTKLDSIAATTKDGFLSTKKTDKLIEAIRSYPIPNSRDDLIDIILYLKDKANNEELSDVCNEKINECTDKLNLMYPHDSDARRVSEKMEVRKNEIKKEERRNDRSFLINMIIFFLILGLLFFVTMLFKDNDKGKSNNTDNNTIQTEVIKESSKEKAEDSDKRKDENNESIEDNDVKGQVDEQYAALQEKLEALPEIDTDNYEKVVAELASLLWKPITDEAETAKKTFKSPSKDEKYERKIKNQWYGEVKAKARIIKAFYNKNTEALGEIDNSDLEKLLEKGYIE